MKKSIILLVSFVMFFNCSFANSDMNTTNFIAVEKQLTSNTNIIGDFVQERQIQGIDNPLKSSGTFGLSDDGSLIWTQTKPFKSVMTISHDKLSQTIMDNPPTIMTKESQPVVFTFTQLFMSILKGDTKSVQQYFNVDFTGDAQSWSIVFTPKTAPINKAIKSLIFKGGKNIDSIKVVDTQSNVISIIFSNIIDKSDK